MAARWARGSPVKAGWRCRRGKTAKRARAGVPEDGPDNVALEEAKDGDLKGAVELLREAMQEPGAGSMREDARTGLMASGLVRATESEECKVFVARGAEGDGLLGIALLAFGDALASFRSELPYKPRGGCHVSNMAVALSHRRRGIATRLLRWCEEEALRRGVDVAYLHAYEDALPALSFYRSHGYEVVAREPQGFLSSLPGFGPKRARRLLMAKRLTSAQ